MAKKPTRTQPSLPGFDTDFASEPVETPASFIERTDPPTNGFHVARELERRAAPKSEAPASAPISSGEKSKARDIIAAIRTLKEIEARRTPATSRYGEMFHAMDHYVESCCLNRPFV